MRMRGNLRDCGCSLGRLGYNTPSGTCFWQVLNNNQSQVYSTNSSGQTAQYLLSYSSPQVIDGVFYTKSGSGLYYINCGAGATSPPPLSATFAGLAGNGVYTSAAAAWAGPPAVAMPVVAWAVAMPPLGPVYDGNVMPPPIQSGVWLPLNAMYSIPAGYTRYYTYGNTTMFPAGAALHGMDVPNGSAAPVPPTWGNGVYADAASAYAAINAATTFIPGGSGAVAPSSPVAISYSPGSTTYTGPTNSPGLLVAANTPAAPETGGIPTGLLIVGAIAAKILLFS